MAAYPKTGSNLDSTIKTSLSTQIIIMVNNEPVGAIQSFSENQSRPMKRIGEVGLDGVVEIVPSGFVTATLEVTRMAFDGLSLPEAFARGFINLQSQRIPFDIIVIDQFSGTGDDAIVHTYHNCWFNKLSKAYQQNDYTIMQNAGIDVEFISSVRANESVVLSQGVGGTRQIGNVQIDAVEVAADSGTTRGSLDFPGLISAAF